MATAALGFACQKQTAPKNEAPNTANANSTIAQPATVKTIKPESPTEAYKMLYEAVKAKDIEKTKQLVTKSTEGLAQFMAAQQKQPVEKSYENGFTSTTLSPSLPQIRDERIKDNFGAIEVYNDKDKRWEDLPFMFEDGGWRLAVGDIFQDTYKSPGKGKAQIEMEASNKTIPIVPENGNKTAETPSANKPK